MRVRTSWKVILSGLALLLLAGCGGGESTSAPQAVENATQPPADLPPSPSPQPPDPVARVNGVPIALAAYERALNRAAPETNVADSSVLSRQVLDTLIEQELINQGAAALGISVTDAEVEAQMDELRLSEAGTVEAWQEWLALNQYTEDELRLDLRNSLLTQRVTELLSQPYYGIVPQVNARHILVATEAEANAALTRITNGEDFGAVAAQLSLDVTTKDVGGSLGWFTVYELVDRRLADVAYGLLPGQISPPVATTLGFHILQTLEAAQRPIEPERLVDIIPAIFNEWRDTLLQSAVIERFLD